MASDPPGPARRRRVTYNEVGVHSRLQGHAPVLFPRQVPDAGGLPIWNAINPGKCMQPPGLSLPKIGVVSFLGSAPPKISPAGILTISPAPFGTLVVKIENPFSGFSVLGSVVPAAGISSLFCSFMFAPLNFEPKNICPRRD